jgi:hypothetical protein
MGAKEAMVPGIIAVVSIFVLANSAITMKTYNDQKKAPDSSYHFAMFMMLVSLVGLFGGGFFAYKAFKGGAAATPAPAAAAAQSAASEAAGSKTNLASQELGLANQLEKKAAEASFRAEKAKEAAKLANSLGATVAQLKQKNN